MQPIIDPIWIYIISRLDYIQHGVRALFVLSILSCIWFAFSLFYKKNGTDEYFNTPSQNIFNKSKNLETDMFSLISQTVDEIKRAKSSNTAKEQLLFIEGSMQHYSSSVDKLHKKADKVYESLIKDYYQEIDRYKKYLKYSIISAFCMMFIQMIIPDTNTGYKMFIVSYITPDNLGMAKDVTKETIEWLLQSIVNSIQQLK